MMKRTYSSASKKVGGFVRWLISGVIIAIVVLPAMVTVAEM
ncbi:MAG: hypothetical protein WA632_11000 [Gallionella sp.]